MSLLMSFLGHCMFHFSLDPFTGLSRQAWACTSGVTGSSQTVSLITPSTEEKYI